MLNPNHLDIMAIRQAHPLPVVAGAAVKLHRAGAEFKGCCPFHSDRSTSFTIFAGGQRFHCFGCGASGDVLDFVRRTHGVTLHEAAAMLGTDNLPAVRVAPVIKDEKPARINEARAIWRDASPVRGTLAETYLRSRGLHLPIPDSIRFARLRYGKKGPVLPCLVACVASIDNKLVGIQRTYLNDDGSGKASVPKPKLSLGQVAGGAIRLAPAAGRLIVCEGLEDGLTLMQGSGRAVWVAAGSSMLPRMLFPLGVSNVAIGGDGDDVGQRAAAIAVQAFAARGLKSRAFFPNEGCKDFNDELLGLRA